jgi:hypothetical protein
MSDLLNNSSSLSVGLNILLAVLFFSSCCLCSISFLLLFKSSHQRNKSYCPKTMRLLKVSSFRLPSSSVGALVVSVFRCVHLVTLMGPQRARATSVSCLLFLLIEKKGWGRGKHHVVSMCFRLSCAFLGLVGMGLPKSEHFLHVGSVPSHLGVAGFRHWLFIVCVGLLRFLVSLWCFCWDWCAYCIYGIYGRGVPSHLGVARLRYWFFCVWRGSVTVIGAMFCYLRNCLF